MMLGPARPPSHPRWMYFAFAIAILAADLLTKHMVTVNLATPIHPIVVTAADGPTPLLALAARGGGEEAIRGEAATGAVVRLEKQPLKADQPVAQTDLGREIVVTDGLRMPTPRRLRLTAEHVGKPLGAVLGDAWRTSEAAMQDVLDKHSYVVTAHRLDPDASFAGGRAYALLDRALPILSGPLHGDIVYAENKGAAFSFLESAPPLFRWGLFVAVSSTASLVMIWWLARGVLFSALSAWSLAAILAGAVGNLVDRANYTVVIDFIYNYILVDGRVVGWPVYNVADIGITVGVILIALESLLRKPAAIVPAAS